MMNIPSWEQESIRRAILIAVRSAPIFSHPWDGDMVQWHSAFFQVDRQKPVVHLCEDSQFAPCSHSVPSYLVVQVFIALDDKGIKQMRALFHEACDPKP